MPLIIGLVGEKGSGKGTFVRLLGEYAQGKRVASVRSVDILADTLTLWDIPLTRHNLQHLAIVMDEGYGKGTLTHAVKTKIEKLSDDIIVFDGVRWESDAKMIQGFPNHAIVYITAPIELRYERSKTRRQKVDESNATFEQFEREERAKTELDIAKIGEGADFKIENGGALEYLEKKVEEFCEKFVK